MVTLYMHACVCVYVYVCVCVLSEREHGKGLCVSSSVQRSICKDDSS